MKMSEGERLVWAAAYAALLRERQADCRAQPSYHRRQAELERGAVHDAIEGACYAVGSMREERDAIEAGFGDGGEVVSMLDEMLGGSG